MKLFKTWYLFVFVLLISSNLSAQTEKNPRVNIKTNPFAAMLNMIPLSAEFFVTQTWSVSANGFLINSKNGSGATYFDQNGFGISPEVRYYFVTTETKGQKNRVYVGGIYSYEEYTNTTLDRYDEPIAGWNHGMGGALVFGNQWFFKNRFTLDVFMGPGYTNYVKNANYDSNLSKGGFLLSMAGVKSSGTKIKFGFSIGIAF